jgi:hypothetical protein
MPLQIYSDIYSSGSVPEGWTPTKGGTVKYPVRNPAVRRYLRSLLAGKWQKLSSSAALVKSIALNMLQARSRA